MARNSYDDLRPVGTVFVHQFCHEETWCSASTETGPFWWEYQVVKHILTPDWPGDKEWSWKEMWQPLGRTELQTQQEVADEQPGMAPDADCRCAMDPDSQHTTNQM